MMGNNDVIRKKLLKIISINEISKYLYLENTVETKEVITFKQEFALELGEGYDFGEIALDSETNKIR